MWCRTTDLEALEAAHIGGIRAILVQAISEAAKRFYQGHGFIASPLDALMLMITLAETLKMLGADEINLG